MYFVLLKLYIIIHIFEKKHYCMEEIVFFWKKKSQNDEYPNEEYPEAANERIRDLMSQYPENPAKSPPSAKPPVSQIISMPLIKPANAAGKIYAKRNLENGISRRRKAISQVAIRSIYIISKFSVQ